VHQFNLRPLSRPRQVWLPPSNKGYQLLHKMGWSEDGAAGAGLGARAQGRVQPVKTQLRPDKRGLGAAMPRGAEYRVTHFPSHHEDEVRRQGWSKALHAHDVQFGAPTRAQRARLRRLAKELQAQAAQAEARRMRRLRAELRGSLRDDVLHRLAELDG